MSFLNQSSHCYNGKDLYNSNKKEVSGVGVLEFDDIFDDLQIHHLKKTLPNFEKNNSVHIHSKKLLEEDEKNKFLKEKARTENIQNQSSFNENPISCNNFKKLNSFYSRALNLNKNFPLTEDPILNPFQKKSPNSEKFINTMCSKKEIQNNQKNENDLNNLLKKELKNFDGDHIEKSENASHDESQNIVNIIKHLSEYSHNNKIKMEKNLKNNENTINFSYEDFQKVFILIKRLFINIFYS